MPTAPCPLEVSADQPRKPEQAVSRWPHWLAWLLVCAAFSQIWVGSAVTTYNAGTAIKDWPTTDGHWFYPPRLWLAAAWDLFLAYGHRLLGALVIMITITLGVVLWVVDRRKWMRWLATAAVAGVLLQEAFGGLRVLSGELLPAKFHGCTAPLLLGLCATLVTLTSAAWQTPVRPSPLAAGPSPFAARLALAVTLAVYVQIVFCSQLRHLAPDAEPGWCVFWLWLVLILGGLIALGLVGLLIRVLRQVRRQPMIVRRVGLLGALFLAQLVLAAGTWVTNYGWPTWFADHLWHVRYTIVAEGRLQVVMTTAHAACGSLTLAASLSLTLWSLRLLRGPPALWRNEGKGGRGKRGNEK